MNTCPLCATTGGKLVYKNQLFRVILAEDENYPGFVRLILNGHVQEMTDLSPAESLEVFTAVLKIEKLVREIYHPDKINLASLGNVVPHLHWHIIPRYFKDKHFPNPIWGEITHSDYVPQLLSAETELISRLPLIFT